MTGRVATGAHGVAAHIFNDKQEAKTVNAECWEPWKP